MAFDEWMAALEARHLADLTFPEVSRALRALSSTYVERREQIRHGAALSGAGKRAAFALFYGPLHFLIVRHIVTSIEGATVVPATLLDLGCGTGAAGAAWATASAAPPTVVGVDLNKWALDEAGRTYRDFRLSARTRMNAIEKIDLPKSRVAFIAAYAINELAQAERERVITTLFDRASSGDRVLIVEPLAGFVAPWWKGCADRARAAGGRADEWRFRADLPPIVKKLDRAAGLRHDELTARSIFL
ncbi:MAG TPA: methyltransferase domain-containing protein [Vicinamibacterales bacterium]|jgi:SAM-dependent methyltransferase|nr:methyltransferase domain-containing protein [Vicinamibacterales bacterium]